MADPRVSQDPVVIVRESDAPPTAVSQAPAAVVVSNVSTPRVSQAAAAVVHQVAGPPIYLSQMTVAIVGRGLFKRHINVFVT